MKHNLLFVSSIERNDNEFMVETGGLIKVTEHLKCFQYVSIK